MRHARERRNLLLCQKTFTSTLTGRRGWVYIPAIDAAADANGAKNFLRDRAVGPDFGREQSLFCGGLFLSVASKDVCSLTSEERREA